MEKSEAIKRHAELSGELKRHNHLYYVECEPEISDYSYDMMFKELQRIEDEFPGLLTTDSPTQTVGAI